MATRSRIGVLRDNDVVESVYCHWDGYPEHNGRILVEHYSDPVKVDELISLGDLSSLNKEIGDDEGTDKFDRVMNDLAAIGHNKSCIFYGRDRGEKDVSSITHSLEEWPKEEWGYLFKNGRWYVRDEYRKDDFRLVAEVLTELEEEFYPA